MAEFKEFEEFKNESNQQRTNRQLGIEHRKQIHCRHTKLLNSSYSLNSFSSSRFDRIT